MGKVVDLLTSAWYGDSILTLHFPEDWDIHVVKQNNYAALTDFEIREKIRNPIGTPLLSHLAQGKRRVAILVDDIHRPTPTQKIMPFVLNELKNGGIRLDQVVIVMAVACHRLATKEDFIRKVGRDIIKNVRTVSHDCTRNLLYLGETARGTPIYVNKFVSECDIKIGIGGIYPHEHAGFGGGAKIIHPGICGITTVKSLHNNLKGVPRGSIKDSQFRADIEEVAEKVGLDFSINVLINQNRDISHAFCGHRMLAYREAATVAQKLYSVQPIDDADIVIANVYPFDTSLHFISKGLWPLRYGKNSRTKIIVASCPEGLGYHALSLKSLLGWSGFVRRLRALSTHDIYNFFAHQRKKDAGFFFFSPSLRKHDLKKMYPEAQLFNTWESLIQKLKSKHNTVPLKVAVYHCAPLQIPLTGGNRHERF